MARYRTSLGSESIVLGGQKWPIREHVVDIPEELFDELKMADQLAEPIPYAVENEPPPPPATDGRNKAP